MRTAIIGAAGQLGRELCARLGDQAVPLTRRELDLTDPESQRRALEPLGPEAVINAAAYNFVDAAEEHPADAFAVNTFGVRALAQLCRRLGCPLVHFSTDYVFGLQSDRSVPYDEGSLPGPVSVYGLSKLAGEYAVRATWPRHFIIRTCGLYGLRGSGGKGRNFVETMLQVGRQRGQVQVVDDQRCTPTYAADLAEATVRLMRTEAFGLYHWTNAGDCTWFELAGELFRRAGLQVKCEPISSAQYGALARRPRYSVLSTAKFTRLTGLEPRPWPQALQAYLDARRADASV